DAVKAHDAGELRILCRDERGHLPTGRLPDHDKTLRIDTESARVPADECDGMPEVVHLCGMPHGGREPVVDGEPGEARARQWLEQRRDVGHLVAGFPS